MPPQPAAGHPSKFILNDGSAVSLDLYRLYIDRIMKHYDLVWEQFRVYFGFTAGLVVVIGFVLKPLLETGITRMSFLPSLLLIGLSIVGIRMGYVWVTVAKDGNRWQRLLNETISDMESTLFQHPESGLYHRIVKLDQETNPDYSRIVGSTKASS